MICVFNAGSRFTSCSQVHSSDNLIHEWPVLMHSQVITKKTHYGASDQAERGELI